MWEYYVSVGSVAVAGRRRGNDLGGLGDFGGLVVVGWSKHVDEGTAVGAGAELAHTTMLLVYVTAGTDVDGGCYRDTEPTDGNVSFP